MALDADTIVDRRRMRRKLTFWRVLAILIVIGAVVAEWAGASRGLGVLINIANQGLFDTPLMFVALVTLAVIGITLHGLVVAAEHRLVQT